MPPPQPQSSRPYRVLLPLVRFFQTEAASGVVLLVCTVLALALANSPWRKDFADLLHLPVSIGVGDWKLSHPLEWWINDGLMTLFFFVVGLEIKRELIDGELRDPRKAALPAAAALGGMVVPALIYFALRYNGPGERGWGIPMATDIAFVVGVLALLGPRVPVGLKIMLLSLAIVDDLGAILVIALVYSGLKSALALGLALAGLGVVVLMRALGVRAISPYALVGVVVWYCTHESGIHPTIAGVALGLLTPVRESIGKLELLAVTRAVTVRLERDRAPDDDLQGHDHTMGELIRAAQHSLSPLHRLENALHPWVAFLIMPLFALANAGVEVEPALLANPVAGSVALGLVLGKPVGIVLFSLAAVALGLARLPTGVDRRVLLGAGCLGGIGFTMSLFVTHLAFAGNPDLLDAGKVGTLAGSVASAVLGSVLLLLFLKPRREPDER